MLSLLKKLIKSHFINNLSIPDIQHSLQRLKINQFNPVTIFDVGAFQGDFALLTQRIWPQSKVYCFEPLSKKVAFINQLSKNNPNIKVFEGLVGNKNIDNLEFNENETASSVLEEHISKDFNKSVKKMRTIDTCITEFDLSYPDFLKIDTQGFEYEVLEGAIQTLPHIQIILAELNFIDIHKNVKLAADVIQWLDNNNFVAFDITEIHRRPSDNAIWQTDFLFVKRDSVFRANKRW
jgi:FkbM family methyltransferase